MNNSTEILKKAIDLSKLSDNESENKAMVENFQRIFNWIEALSNIDTKDIEPLIHPFPKKYFPREDIPSECLSHDEVLSNAPQKNSNYIIVPQVK